MLAATETDNGTLFSLIFTAFGLVASLFAYARWQAKQTHDVNAITTGTLRDFIRSQDVRLEKMEGELTVLRGVQTTQTAEIATLKEKVRQLESQRDHLLAENTAHRAEIVALNVRIVEQQGEIVRLQGELAKADDEAQIQSALQSRLKQQLDAYEKKAGGIVGA